MLRLVIGALLIATAAQSILTFTDSEARPRHSWSVHSHHARSVRHVARVRHVHHVRHRYHVARQMAPQSPSAASWFGGFQSDVVGAARSYVGAGAIFGRSNLWCARFVNFVLEKTGHHGTNSDLAFSFAHYGHEVVGPQVGAIAVMARRGGGHVGIVSGIDRSGNPILISGNNMGRVREATYPRSRILHYRAI